MYREDVTAEVRGTDGNGQMDGNFGVCAVTSNAGRTERRRTRRVELR